MNQSIRRQGCTNRIRGLVIHSEEVPLDLVDNREALEKHLFKSFFKNDFALQVLIGIQELLFAPKVIPGTGTGFAALEKVP